MKLYIIIIIIKITTIACLLHVFAVCFITSVCVPLHVAVSLQSVLSCRREV